MKAKKIFGLILSTFILIQTFFAFETDQYDLPGAPLADIGEEFAADALEKVRKAIGLLNAEIAESLAAQLPDHQRNGAAQRRRARHGHNRAYFSAEGYI